MKVKVFIFSKSYDGFCLYLVGRSQDFIEHYPQPCSQPRGQGHHHHWIFYQRAGTGATVTSVGPLPGSWLAACMSDLTLDLQVHLYVYHEGRAGLGGAVGCASDWRQEVAGSTPAKVGNILSWRLIMKYFLRSFSPFR